jgi:gamma-glutamyltranspeptidase/glutathione hydrolase
MKIQAVHEQANRSVVMSRRRFTQSCAGAGVAFAMAGSRRLAGGAEPEKPAGAIRGEPTAEKVGMQVLASGGNAIDAAVAAALTAAVVVPHQTGIGGYGGHMTLALAKEKRVTSIDFNSMAPAAATGDMFPLDEQGKVLGQANMYGWRAAGVPGILAGLQLVRDRYGTRPFGELARPAIDLVRNGFPLASAAAPLRTAARQLEADPASRRLYFRGGKPLEAGDVYSNLDLANMLEDLTKENSVESFYRGPIAKQIAAAFAQGGGLVTASDMAAYQAREVQPLSITWGDWTIYTAPLTAGGATALEALRILQELKWADRPPSTDTTQLQIEAMRYAWQDRLQLLGDPEHADVPLARLLDRRYAQAAAAEIERAVAARRPLPVRTTTRPDQGTIHLSVADRHGNLVALTLTHGGAYGARVTVPGLGLTLGHGMSRFDPHPGHPNTPGPHKRPLHNMCPTIVARNGRPVIAVGGRGGRKIPNAVTEVLLQVVARGKGLPEAVAAPRPNTEGALAVSFERAWPVDQLSDLKQRGYNVSTATSATISAVGLEDNALGFVTAMR